MHRAICELSCQLALYRKKHGQFAMLLKDACDVYTDLARYGFAAAFITSVRGAIHSGAGARLAKIYHELKQLEAA